MNRREETLMTDAGTCQKITYQALFSCGESDEWDRDSSAPRILRVRDKLRTYYHDRLDGWIRIGFAEACIHDPLT